VSRLGPSSRHRSREVALQVLFALDVVEGRKCAPVPTAEEVFDQVASNFEMPAGTVVFAEQLVRDVRQHGEELDRILSEHSTRWRLSRMAAVDRNILRLASCELVFSDTPAAVVLDEAVQLARRFGGEASSSFVNGILDAVVRARQSPES